jgi:hypothetical protein
MDERNVKGTQGKKKSHGLQPTLPHASTYKEIEFVFQEDPEKMQLLVQAGSILRINDGDLQPG